MQTQKLPTASGFRAFLCLLLAILSGCSKSGGTSGSGPVLRLSQRNEPVDLDPATATLPDEFFVIRALSEGLLTPDPTGLTPRAALAESYTISPDGLTYTFHLRDTKWSNGEPITSADFVDSYRRFLTPATAAPKANLFFAVKNAREFATGKLKDFGAVGFAAPDPRTLVVTLQAPSVRFLHYVASGPWIPVNPRVVAKHQRQWTQPENYVGSGPFTLAEWRPQQRIIVRKNPNYYAVDKIKVAEVQFIRFDSGDSEERGFRAGQVDVTMDIPKTKVAVYAADHPGEFHRAPLGETRFLAFNTTRPALKDERLRRALSLAIDRQRIVDRVTLGGQEPASRFIAPELHSGVPPPPAAALHSFDPEEARRLFAAAGYGTGKELPKLELSAWSPSQSPVLEAIQDMWKRELGVNVNLVIHEAKVHLDALNAGDFDIAFATTIIDVADAAAVLEDFTDSGANNFPHWHSDAYSRLVADAKTQADNRGQAAKLAEAEALLLQAAPVAPVYFNAKNWLMSPRVRGWQEDAVWTRFFQNVSLDEK